MKPTLPLLATVALSFLTSNHAHAVLNVSSSSFTYTQNFNGLITSGTNQAWTNDSTLSGWSLFTGATIPAAITTYNAGDGSSNVGSYYSFGTGTTTDRALGSAASGGTYFGSPGNNAVAGYIALGLNNSSGGDITDLTFSYSGEQWRNGGNATAQSLTVQYGIGSTFASVTTWTSPGTGFNFTGPIATATPAAVNGNVAGSVTGRGGTLSSLTWQNGQTLWIRWADLNDSGNDHGLAIDDFNISSLTVVPEPASAMLGSLGFLMLIRRRR